MVQLVYRCLSGSHGPGQMAQVHLVESVYSSKSALYINQVKKTGQYIFFFQLLKNSKVTLGQYS